MVLCILGFTDVIGARALYDTHSQEWDEGGYLKPSVSDIPIKQFDVHNIGKISMTITNFGAFGTGYVSNPIIDGEIAPSCEYPINSDLSYLFTGALWIGAVVGRDTLVSGAADGWAENTPELWPEGGPGGAIISRSNLRARTNFDDDAISEQDFICTFTDTFPDISGIDQNDNRPHIPLNVSIKQSSYAWSYDYAEDFILFDYKITNIGLFPIREMYMGLYIDADVHHRSVSGFVGAGDDICGFRRTVDMPPGFCIDKDTVNIAWISDNDGDPTDDGNWSFTSPYAVTGTRVVRTPFDTMAIDTSTGDDQSGLNYSFNWWISNTAALLDFGPRKAGTDDDPFRPFGSHLGTPTGDRTKYYIMSHPEFDYDQLFVAISHTAEGYLPPPRPSQASDFANGYDTRYLLSFGPFDIRPGDTVPVTVAYLAGDEFHTSPTNFVELFDGINPNVFYESLNFDDFGENARWASWVFDNPGYDTPTDEYPEGDGDSGKFCWTEICDTVYDTIFIDEITIDSIDTIISCDSTKMYYAGDGVPDFRGAAPPPPPVIKVIPGFGKVTLRWNGQVSENAVDVFSNQKDFEGYRVYYAQGDRRSDYVFLTAYDIEDYKVYQFVQLYDTLYWEQISLPITGDRLRSLYGADFDANQYYDPLHYFTDPYTGKLHYFIPQDWNQSNLSDPRLIHKVYPNASRTDSSDTTEEGWLRHYEYEYEITNLQPSVAYNFSVTAFDYGSLKIDLGALESSPLVNAVQEFPLPSAETVEEEGLDVIVYPNPYRIDGGYAAAGYENRDRTKSSERARVIHFANLPRICTIRIFSIDGDLIKQIDHYRPEGGPGSQEEVWNVISRNTQAIVTGIYLWHVQSDMGDQLGKLVIIK
jgi:hypothetical protein